MTPTTGSTTRLYAFSIVLFYACNCCLAIKYNIWFKYPQPFTPSQPLIYCKENATEFNVTAPASQVNCTTQIPIYVNTLDSERAYIPYSYNQFDFCPSIEGFEYSESDFIEWDDRIFRTSYDIKFLRNEQCRLLCKRPYDLSRIFDIHRLSVTKMLMNKEYYLHLFADNFPISWCFNQNPLDCYVGAPVGYYVDTNGNPNDQRIKKRSDTKTDTFYLFNHLDFTFIYESGVGKSWGDSLGDKVGRITAIKVRPRSIRHEKNNFKNCAVDSPLLEIPNHLNYSSAFTVYHSYSVTFIRDDTTGSDKRWNQLLSTLSDANSGKWFILTALLIVILLAIPFTFIFSRTILTKHELFGWINSKPLSNPNSGWQSIANDIFRSPKYPLMFSSFIGSGVQYICCLGVVEFLALLIHFSTSLVLIVLATILMLLFVGGIGGYVSSRFYKSFGGQQWKYNCLLTASLNPIMLTAVLFLARNFLLMEQSSSLAFPIGLTASLFILLISFGLALPLTFAGAYLGFNYQTTIEYPLRPIANIRDIPKSSVYNMLPIYLMMTGLFPFIAVWMVENYPFFNSGEFIMTSASITICIQTAICATYLNIMDENHEWWWRAYLGTGFAAVYYLIHCICFIATTIIIDDLISGLLYTFFALVLSVLLFSMIGTIGFITSFAFIWMTYSLNKPNTDIDYSTFPEAT
ncbi:transmembrane 9 superfamily member 2-like [Oppia nitens]|uniref:transmembrane 9 superfamily member 2-like n=1 Tax=Oppia nitens TaxID=1686743 RepID=UPI0023DBA560|nr:transmembrane 9 superfamily member 2-like [Oppia nitens]